MKVYKFTSYIEKEYAILRPSSKENIKEINLLDVWWDSWGSNGNKIGDFTFCYGIKICKLSVFNLLQENFKDIKGVDIKINKTERELKAKKPKRLKWLPQEDIALKSFFSPTYFDCLPQSSLVKTERGRIELIGVSELKGEEIIPREKGKGIFFDKEVINNYDFFTLQNTNLLLCTERVKEFCEDKEFNNIIFLEMGDII
ncbi:hypothetical protein [Capnocytophaga gingivalis]|jgi:hypothetical protein